jgi:hypothetical protein
VRILEVISFDVKSVLLQIICVVGVRTTRTPGETRG